MVNWPGNFSVLEMERTFFIDAFVAEGLDGNPACVTFLERPLAKGELLAIAARNALPETAFILQSAEGYNLRWFTPDIEMDLCGHATLASAYAVLELMEHPAGEAPSQVTFNTAEGKIGVTREPEGFYTLNFPQRPPQPAELPAPIWEALSIKPQEVLLSRDYLLRYRSEEEIRELKISNLPLFNSINMDPGGVVVTAQASTPGVDFVSRFFTPQATILEDPVTGSAHCTLAPFWAERLNKSSLTAMQLSERGGLLKCRLEEKRVLISGRARLSHKASGADL